MLKSSVSLVNIVLIVFAANLQAQSSLFSRASLRSLVKEHLRKAWEIYFAYKAVHGSEDLAPFCDLAFGLAKAGCFAEAVQVLKAMPKPTKIFAQSQYWNAYREVAVIATQMGHCELAKRLASQIPRFVSYFKEPEGDMKKASVVKAIAQSLRKLSPDRARRQLKGTISVARQIDDTFWRGDALCALAKAALKIAPQEAKTLSAQVLAIAEKCPKETRRLHLLISVTPVINHWDTQKAQQIFNRAIQIALRQPNDHNQRDWAIWWVIKGMMEAGLWNEAIKVADLLPETRPKVPFDIPYYAPIVEPPPTKWEALKAIAKSLAERKLFAKALKIVEDIKEPYSRAEAYISVAKFVAKPEPEKARQLLWQAMDIATKKVDPKFVSFLFVTIVETATEVAPQDAVKLALMATKTLQGLDNYSSSQSLSWLAAKIANADIKTAQNLFAMAVKSARSISKPSKRMVALGGIVGQMCQAKFFGEAQKLLQEIEKASLARGNVSPGRWCLSMRNIIVAMAESGQAKQALALLPKLNACYDEDRFEALIAVAKNLARSEIRNSEKLLCQALQIARSKWQEYEMQKQNFAQLSVTRVHPPYDAFNFNLKVILTVAQIVSRSGKN